MEFLKDLVTVSQDFFQQMNWQSLSLDFFILLFFATMIILYSLLLGRNKMIAIVLALYIDLALFSSLPYLNPWLKSLDSDFLAWRLLLFLLVFFVLFIILSKYALTSEFTSKKGMLWSNLLYSFFLVGFFIHIILDLVPVYFTDKLAPFSKMIFLSMNSRFFWILTPLIAMLFFKIREDY